MEARRQEQIARENERRANMNAVEAKRQEALTSAQLSQGKLQHLVMVKFKPNTPQSSIEKFTNNFRSLKGSIPFVLSFEHGINNSPENLNRGLTHLYKVTFKNEKDRDDYLVHAEHKKFVKMVEELGAVEEVFVFDYNPDQ